LDEEALAMLPDNGILPEIYESITFCNKVREDSKAHSRYDDPDEEGSFPHS
jgi:hypothetical protein